MVYVSLFLLPLAQLWAMLAGSVIEPGWYMTLDLRTVISRENDQAKNNLSWHSGVFLKVKYSWRKAWMIDFCHDLQAPEIFIDMRQWQYIKSMREAHLFLVYWFRLVDCKAVEKSATAAYGRWRIADVPTSGLIRTRLCLYSTLTTGGWEEDRGVEELSYFPQEGRERFPFGWKIMWLYLSREKFEGASHREGGEELVKEHLS